MRAFVAIQPPKELSEQLWQGFAPVRDLAPQCRWVPAANIHLTVKFLGEVDAHQVDETATALSDVVSRARQYTARVTGAGVFPGGGAVRVIWAALSEGDQDTVQLAGAIDRALRQVGFASERRPFRSHLTMARVGDRDRGGLSVAARSSLARLAGTDWGAWQVREVALMRSNLRPAGPVYDVVARFPLGGLIAGRAELC